MNMKEFYAEECGQDYGGLCWQEQIRQSVTKEILSEVLNLGIVKFHIDFENEIIEYEYNPHSIDFQNIEIDFENVRIDYEHMFDSITISDFTKKCYELSEHD